jgi:hypothetical protein
MSWEVMRAETAPCVCGAGTITYTFEMDDWNRERKTSHIAERERQARRLELFEQARILACQRHLADWLTSFSGLSKKEAWKKHTGGSGYPALGTFYLQVKQAGSITNYLKSCFDREFPEIIEKLGIRDTGIAAILEEYTQIKVESPEDRLPL